MSSSSYGTTSAMSSRSRSNSEALSRSHGTGSDNSIIAGVNASLLYRSSKTSIHKAAMKKLHDDDEEAAKQLKKKVGMSSIQQNTSYTNKQRLESGKAVGIGLLSRSIKNRMSSSISSSSSSSSSNGGGGGGDDPGDRGGTVVTGTRSEFAVNSADVAAHSNMVTAGTTTPRKEWLHSALIDGEIRRLNGNGPRVGTVGTSKDLNKVSQPYLSPLLPRLVVDKHAHHPHSPHNYNYNYNCPSTPPQTPPLPATPLVAIAAATGTAATTTTPLEYRISRGFASANMELHHHQSQQSQQQHSPPYFHENESSVSLLSCARTKNLLGDGCNVNQNYHHSSDNSKNMNNIPHLLRRQLSSSNSRSSNSSNSNAPHGVRNGEGESCIARALVLAEEAEDFQTPTKAKRSNRNQKEGSPPHSCAITSAGPYNYSIVRSEPHASYGSAAAAAAVPVPPPATSPLSAVPRCTWKHSALMNRGERLAREKQAIIDEQRAIELDTLAERMIVEILLFDAIRGAYEQIIEEKAIFVCECVSTSVKEHELCFCVHEALLAEEYDRVLFLNKEAEKCIFKDILETVIDEAFLEEMIQKSEVVTAALQERLLNTELLEDAVMLAFDEETNLRVESLLVSLEEALLFEEIRQASLAGHVAEQDQCIEDVLEHVSLTIAGEELVRAACGAYDAVIHQQCVDPFAKSESAIFTALIEEALTVACTEEMDSQTDELFAVAEEAIFAAEWVDAAQRVREELEEAMAAIASAFIEEAIFVDYINSKFADEMTNSIADSSLRYQQMTSYDSLKLLSALRLAANNEDANNNNANTNSNDNNNDRCGLQLLAVANETLKEESIMRFTESCRIVQLTVVRQAAALHSALQAVNTAKRELLTAVSAATDTDAATVTAVEIPMNSNAQQPTDLLKQHLDNAALLFSTFSAKVREVNDIQSPQEKQLVRDYYMAVDMTNTVENIVLEAELCDAVRLSQIEEEQRDTKLLFSAVDELIRDELISDSIYHAFKAEQESRVARLTLQFEEAIVESALTSAVVDAYIAEESLLVDKTVLHMVESDLCSLEIKAALDQAYDSEIEAQTLCGAQRLEDSLLDVLLNQCLAVACTEEMDSQTDELFAVAEEAIFAAEWVDAAQRVREELEEAMAENVCTTALNDLIDFSVNHTLDTYIDDLIQQQAVIDKITWAHLKVELVQQQQQQQQQGGKKKDKSLSPLLLCSASISSSDGKSNEAIDDSTMNVQQEELFAVPLASAQTELVAADREAKKNLSIRTAEWTSAISFAAAAQGALLETAEAVNIAERQMTALKEQLNQYHMIDMASYAETAAVLHFLQESLQKQQSIQAEERDLVARYEKGVSLFFVLEEAVLSQEMLFAVQNAQRQHAADLICELSAATEEAVLAAELVSAMLQVREEQEVQVVDQVCDLSESVLLAEVVAQLMSCEIDRVVEDTALRSKLNAVEKHLKELVRYREGGDIGTYIKVDYLVSRLATVNGDIAESAQRVKNDFQAMDNTVENELFHKEAAIQAFQCTAKVVDGVAQILKEHRAKIGAQHALEKASVLAAENDMSVIEDVLSRIPMDMAMEGSLYGIYTRTEEAISLVENVVFMTNLEEALAVACTEEMDSRTDELFSVAEEAIFAAEWVDAAQRVREELESQTAMSIFSVVEENIVEALFNRAYYEEIGQVEIKNQVHDCHNVVERKLCNFKRQSRRERKSHSEVANARDGDREDDEDEDEGEEEDDEKGMHSMSSSPDDVAILIELVDRTENISSTLMDNYFDYRSRSLVCSYKDTTATASSTSTEEEEVLLLLLASAEKHVATARKRLAIEQLLSANLSSELDSHYLQLSEMCGETVASTDAATALLDSVHAALYMELTNRTHEAVLINLLSKGDSVFRAVVNAVITAIIEEALAVACTEEMDSRTDELFAVAEEAIFAAEWVDAAQRVREELEEAMTVLLASKIEEGIILLVIEDMFQSELSLCIHDRPCVAQLAEINSFLRDLRHILPHSGTEAIVENCVNSDYTLLTNRTQRAQDAILASIARAQLDYTEKAEALDAAIAEVNTSQMIQLGRAIQIGHQEEAAQKKNVENKETKEEEEEEGIENRLNAAQEELARINEHIEDVACTAAVAATAELFLLTSHSLATMVAHAVEETLLSEYLIQESVSRLVAEYVELDQQQRARRFLCRTSLGRVLFAHMGANDVLNVMKMNITRRCAKEEEEMKMMMMRKKKSAINDEEGNTATTGTTTGTNTDTGDDDDDGDDNASAVIPVVEGPLTIEQLLAMADEPLTSSSYSSSSSSMPLTTTRSIELSKVFKFVASDRQQNSRVIGRHTAAAAAAAAPRQDSSSSVVYVMQDVPEAEDGLHHVVKKSFELPPHKLAALYYSAAAGTASKVGQVVFVRPPSVGRKPRGFFRTGLSLQSNSSSSSSSSPQRSSSNSNSRSRGTAGGAKTRDEVVGGRFSPAAACHSPNMSRFSNNITADLFKNSSSSSRKSLSATVRTHSPLERSTTTTNNNNTPNKGFDNSEEAALVRYVLKVVRRTIIEEVIATAQEIAINIIIMAEEEEEEDEDKEEEDKEEEEEEEEEDVVVNAVADIAVAAVESESGSESGWQSGGSSIGGAADHLSSLSNDIAELIEDYLFEELFQMQITNAINSCTTAYTTERDDLELDFVLSLDKRLAVDHRKSELVNNVNGIAVLSAEAVVVEMPAAKKVLNNDDEEEEEEERKEQLHQQKEEEQQDKKPAAYLSAEKANHRTPTIPAVPTILAIPSSSNTTTTTPSSRGSGRHFAAAAAAAGANRGGGDGGGGECRDGLLDSLDAKLREAAATTTTTTTTQVAPAVSDRSNKDGVEAGRSGASCEHTTTTTIIRGAGTGTGAGAGSSGQRRQEGGILTRRGGLLGSLDAKCKAAMVVRAHSVTAARAVADNDDNNYDNDSSVVSAVALLEHCTEPVSQVEGGASSSSSSSSSSLSYTTAVVCKGKDDAAAAAAPLQSPSLPQLQQQQQQQQQQRKEHGSTATDANANTNTSTSNATPIDINIANTITNTNKVSSRSSGYCTANSCSCTAYAGRGFVCTDCYHTKRRHDGLLKEKEEEAGAGAAPAANTSLGEGFTAIVPATPATVPVENKPWRITEKSSGVSMIDQQQQQQRPGEKEEEEEEGVVEKGHCSAAAAVVMMVQNSSSSSSSSLSDDSDVDDAVDPNNNMSSVEAIAMSPPLPPPSSSSSPPSSPEAPPLLSRSRSRSRSSSSSSSTSKSTASSTITNTANNKNSNLTPISDLLLYACRESMDVNDTASASEHYTHIGGTTPAAAAGSALLPTTTTTTTTATTAATTTTTAITPVPVAHYEEAKTQERSLLSHQQLEERYQEMLCKAEEKQTRIEERRAMKREQKQKDKDKKKAKQKIAIADGTGIVGNNNLSSRSSYAPCSSPSHSPSSSPDEDDDDDDDGSLGAWETQSSDSEDYKASVRSFSPTTDIDNYEAIKRREEEEATRAFRREFYQDAPESSSDDDENETALQNRTHVAATVQGGTGGEVNASTNSMNPLRRGLLLPLSLSPPLAAATVSETNSSSRRKASPFSTSSTSSSTSSSSSSFTSISSGAGAGPGPLVQNPLLVSSRGGRGGQGRGFSLGRGRGRGGGGGGRT